MSGIANTLNRIYLMQVSINLVMFDIAATLSDVGIDTSFISNLVLEITEVIHNRKAQIDFDIARAFTEEADRIDASMTETDMNNIFDPNGKNTSTIPQISELLKSIMEESRMEYYKERFARQSLDHVGKCGPLKNDIVDRAIVIVDQHGQELYKAISECPEEMPKLERRYISLKTMSKMTGISYIVLLHRTKTGVMNYIVVRRGANKTVRVVRYHEEVTSNG